jgi:transglutaminase-like putative cysteine protease
VSEPSTRRRADWPVVAAVALTLLTALAGLHTALQGTGWLLASAFVVIVGLAVAAGVRALRVPSVLATLGAGLALVGLVVLISAPQSAFAGVVPTPQTLTEFNRLALGARDELAQQSVPALAGPGLTFLLVVGAAGLTLVFDLLAFVLKVPALVGFQALVLVIVPVLFPNGSLDPVAVLATAAAWLAVLVLTRDERRRPLAATALGAAALVGALAVSVMLPAVPSRALPVAGSGTGVNPVISLGDTLRQGVDEPVLGYASDDDRGQYLRMLTIDEFSGDTWGPSRLATEVFDIDELPDGPAGLGPEVTSASLRTTVRVLGLDTAWLPAPYAATDVEGLTGAWVYEPGTLTISTGSGGTADQEYTVTSLVAAPTAEQLAAGAPPQGLDPYLAIPESLPEVVGATAVEVTAGSSSAYEQAIALQDFFRTDGGFTYSEQAPVSGGYDGASIGILEEFLEVRSGYCTHFASAMTLMARTLGIPARVAVGYLPGSALGDGAFVVTGNDLHAWPELYFEGAGWVRFEPTVSRGELPAWAAGEDPTDPDVPVPSASPRDGAASAAPSDAPSTAPSASSSPSASPLAGGGGGTDADRDAEYAVLLVAGALLVGVVPFLLRTALRARRLALLRDRRRGARPAWDELVATARDLGIDLASGETPRAFAARLAPTAPAAALDALLRGIERDFYGAGGDPAALGPDLVEVTAALRVKAAPAARLLAAVAPRSLVGGRREFQVTTPRPASGR